MGESPGRVMMLGELLAQGGWVMVPIYLCSIAVAAVFIQKLAQLRSARTSDLVWFDVVLKRVRHGDFSGASEACRGSHPGVRVAEATTMALQEHPERAEAEAHRVGSLELQRLEKHLGVLSFFAQVAPLLGLLGTVVGMVSLFMSLQGAGAGNVEVAQLASGIWKALLTTAAGLSVAVPALAAHTYLAGRTDGLRLQLSDVAERILYAVPRKEDSNGV